MADIDDNTNAEQTALETQATHQASVPDDDVVDFGDDEEFGTGDFQDADEELTPNDIFGLDPLDVLTLEELADYLQISAAAARRAVKEQNLPGRNIGGEWRFLRDAVANWLRGQEAPAQQQQKARQDYSKSTAGSQGDEGGQFSGAAKRPYQSEQSGGEYRPRQRYSESDQQYANQQSGQYGNRRGQYGGGQYGGGQYGGQSRGQYGGNQYGGGQQGGGGQYSDSENKGGSYSRPPRRPFRSEDAGGAGGEGNYAGGAEAGGTSGYRGGGGEGGPRFGGGGGYGGGSGGGGYGAQGQRFGGGPKRKNKRQVFANERGKRLDRRKEDGLPEGQE